MMFSHMSSLPQVAGRKVSTGHVTLLVGTQGLKEFEGSVGPS